jgi:hypothetical protein
MVSSLMIELKQDSLVYFMNSSLLLEKALVAKSLTNLDKEIFA